MTLWIVMAVMCVVAALFIAWPLYRQHGHLTTEMSMAAIAVVVLLSLGLYAYQGSPDIPSGAGVSEVPDVEQMVTSLAQRLEAEPDDLAGWKMLGRSYMTLQDFAGAVRAFERAVALEGSQNAQTLVDLGGALLSRDNSRIEGRTAALFESALALEPNNPAGLFYGGIAALNRGNTELAAERWEILLGLNPPEEIRGILTQRVAEWRGEAVPEIAAPSVATPATGVIVDVSISATALAALPREASVFVIARDPAQPSPPIAVTRRVLSELPATIELNDSNAMIPGRNLSAFSEFEVIVRVSVSGQPVAQPGDWFAAAIVKPADSNRVALLIDQQVP